MRCRLVEVATAKILAVDSADAGNRKKIRETETLGMWGKEARLVLEIVGNLGNRKGCLDRMSISSC